MSSVRNEFYKKKTRKSNNGNFCLLIVGESRSKCLRSKFKEINSNISKISIKIIHQTQLINIPSLRKFYSENNIENEIFDLIKILLKKFLKQMLV